MPPPEVVLDRWVNKQSREHPQFAGYVGKLDLEKVEPALGSFLSFLQGAMTSALRLESANPRVVSSTRLITSISCR
jgi:hypothetical protein